METLDLNAMFPQILAMLEFANDEALRDALAPGVRFYETHTMWTQPAHVSGPCTVVNWPEKHESDFWITVRDPHGKEVERSIGDMQSTLAKAVFTTREGAEAYFRACRLAYDRCAEWRDYAAAKKNGDRSFYHSMKEDYPRVFR